MRDISLRERAKSSGIRPDEATEKAAKEDALQRLWRPTEQWQVHSHHERVHITTVHCLLFLR